MKILQINSTINSGSTGRIAEEIGQTLLNFGHESFVAAAYTDQPSKSEVITIGNHWDRKAHGLITRLSDRHGFGSANSTKQLVNRIKEIQPDLIHLHNIHGYYLNIRVLFNFLKEVQLPVVWTFHDCWPFTGHCSHFEGVDCYKWKKLCHSCPNKKGYPASWLLDNSKKNFIDKNNTFSKIQNLQIVVPSCWLQKHVEFSFLRHNQVHHIYNGIDIDTFRPINTQELIKKYKLEGKKILLGVASTWKKRKALYDFLSISKLIKTDETIVLVGMNKEQISKLPNNILGIERTENLQELATLYSAASVFINPTYVDNFPSTNIEVLACGTPVVTYNTGGSPEAIDKETGLVVDKGDIKGLVKAINKIVAKGKEHYRPLCRSRAEKYFNKDDRYMDYLKIYEKLLPAKP